MVRRYRHGDPEPSFDWPFWIILAIAIVVAVVGGLAWSNADEECKARGGVLIRDYIGVPRCVGGPPR